MDLNEKVSYLKGLCEGLGIDETKPEGKLLVKIIDVLEEIADEILDTNDYIDEVSAVVDEIDEDLSYVEEYLFDDEDDECDCCDDFDCAEIECPACGEVIYLDCDMLGDEEDTLTCPACGEEIDLEFDCCDCCDCDDCE